MGLWGLRWMDRIGGQLVSCGMTTVMNNDCGGWMAGGGIFRLIVTDLYRGLDDYGPRIARAFNENWFQEHGAHNRGTVVVRVTYGIRIPGASGCLVILVL